MTNEQEAMRLILRLASDLDVNSTLRNAIRTPLVDAILACAKAHYAAHPPRVYVSGKMVGEITFDDGKRMPVYYG